MKHSSNSSNDQDYDDPGSFLSATTQTQAASYSYDNYGSSSASDLFGGFFSGNGSYSTGWSDTSAAAAALDTTVASSARAKRTSIVGGGKDTVTIMVYMCGADLESENGMATSDLNEMTKADLGSNISLIVYTGGAKKWKNSVVSSSTNQIYKVENGGVKCINSNAGYVSMTDPSTLSSFISWTAERYPADRFELIFWDHGSGSVSGYGYDENFKSSGSMSLAGINKALKDGGVTFDFIGFDTCFGAELEVCYELKNCARWLCGTEGLSPYSGWNYTTWLHEISRNISAGQDFFSLPEPKDDTSFAVVSLSHIGELFASFDSLASSLTKCICSEDDVESLKKLVRSAGLLFVPNAKSEAYISIYDFLSAVESEFPHLAEEIKDVERDLFNSVQTRTSNGHIPLGVFVCELDASGDISSPFPASYVNGSGEKNQCAFVKDSVGYVPTFAGGGLLGMLFRKNNF